MVAAGYDRTFDAMAPEVGIRCRPHGSLRRGRASSTGQRIELEPGTRLDLGGIGKGYAVDRVAELLAVVGPCLVNAGGDLAVRGGSWPVGVTDDNARADARRNRHIRRDRRRWLRDGEERHHLIDPSTGGPPAGAPLRVTVVAGWAAGPEVPTKAAFLGADVDLPHVFVTGDGRTILAGGLA